MRAGEREMCGIAGIIAPRVDRKVRDEILVRMLDGISHRGPDDWGKYADRAVSVGMRRLSIIDIEGGRQPMVSPDGGTVLVFNGEIYNFSELRTELERKGYVFATRSDTEVVLHGYREWNERLLDRLNGMFAFCVYDRRENSVFLARDHFGIKPLYFSAADGVFMFCSEPKPLMQALGATPRLDLDAAREFLAFKYVPSPRTFVRGMKKLGPGSCMRVRTDGAVVSQRTFWRLEIDPMEISEADAEERLRALLVDAVRRQLVSDVPIGVLLSGGIDSALLLWAARQASAGAAVDAYTIGFKETSFDESTQARETAAHLGVRHHVERIAGLEASEMDAMVGWFGEPFANVSVPANFVLSRATARHVKVALNGSGGDELFGGYDRYYAVWPPPLLSVARSFSPILQPLMNALPVGAGKGSVVTRARRFLETDGMGSAQGHALSVRLYTDEEMNGLAPELGGIRDHVAEAFDSAPGRDDLQRATWTDIGTMMADDYLILVDRTSMAASLEVRVPFLDVDLARFAISLPSAMKINGWEKKAILRRLAKECLPRDVAQAPKRGFESPVGDWFRGKPGEALGKLVSESPARTFLDPRYIQRLQDEHRSLKRDASKQLLAVHTLTRWMKLHGISV